MKKLKKYKKEIIGIVSCLVIVLGVSVWAVAGQKSKIDVEYKDGNLSVEIENAEVKDVLEKIGEEMGAEIEIIEGLEGKIESKKFENVGLREALQKLVGGSGFVAIVEYNKKDVPVKVVVSKKEGEEDKNNLEEVFIDSDNPTIISGRLTNGNIIQVLSNSSIPKRVNFIGEEIPSTGNFYKVEISPNHRWITFIISPSGVLDPGFTGVFNLENNELISINLDNTTLSKWSPNNKYIAFVKYLTSTSEFQSIYIYDIEKRTLSLPLLEKIFYLNSRGNIISEIQWDYNEKKILFNVVKTKYDFQNKKINFIGKELWQIGIDGSNLQKVN